MHENTNLSVGHTYQANSLAFCSETYNQSWLQRRCQKNAAFSWLHVLCLFNKMCYPYTARVHPSVNGQANPSQAKPYRGKCVMYSNWNLKNDYDTSM